MIVKVIIVSVLCLLGSESKSVSDPRWAAAEKIEKRSLSAVVRDNFIQLPAYERISKRSLVSPFEDDVSVELPASERISKRSLKDLPSFKILKRFAASDGDRSVEIPVSEKISKRSLGDLVANRNAFELPAFERISKRYLDGNDRKEGFRTRRKGFYKLKRIRRFPEGSYTGGLTFDSWMGRL